MRKPLILLLTASLFLTACGWRDARINPLNWFGNSRAVTVETGQKSNPLIPRRSALRSRREPVDNSIAIAAVTELRIDRTTTGAILLVTGIANRQGAFSAELRADDSNDDEGNDTLSYTFRVTYPNAPTTVGSEFSRTITVAQSLSNFELRNIRLIRINGVAGAIESRRR